MIRKIKNLMKLIENYDKIMKVIDNYNKSEAVTSIKIEPVTKKKKSYSLANTPQDQKDYINKNLKGEI